MTITAFIRRPSTFVCTMGQLKSEKVSENASECFQKSFTSPYLLNNTSPYYVSDNAIMSSLVWLSLLIFLEVFSTWFSWMDL